MINALVPSLHPTSSETLSSTCVNYRIKLCSFTFQRKISQTSMIQPPPQKKTAKLKAPKSSMEPIIHPPRPEHGLVLKVASCGGVNLATSSSMGAACSRSNTFGEGALGSHRKPRQSSLRILLQRCCFFQLRMKKLKK